LRTTSEHIFIGTENAHVDLREVEDTSFLSESRIANMILTYLCTNPNAEDTVEGIVEWWLLEEDIKWRTAAVKQALSELITNDLLLEKRGSDGRLRYSVNPERLSEIQQQVQKLADEGNSGSQHNDESGH
jgi:hypothetical protein